MSELGAVISSSGLDAASEPVEETCPRELLGLTCLIREYQCLCEQVASTEIEKVRKGRGSALTLTLNLIPSVGNPMTVMTALNLTGMRAEFQASRQAVTATFDLSRPENASLNEFVRETGI